MGVKIFALVVWAILIASIISIIVVLGSMPGKVAEKRDHPNKDTIRIGGWLTLFLAPPGWAFVLMWAYSKPACVRVEPNDLEGMFEENAELRRKLKEAGADA